MTASYRKDPAFTPGTNESGVQSAASGDLAGRSALGNEPATLPGSGIGAAASANVYVKGVQALFEPAIAPQYGQLPPGYRIAEAQEGAGGGSSGAPTFWRKVFRCIGPGGEIVASGASADTALAAGLTVLYYRPLRISPS